MRFDSYEFKVKSKDGALFLQLIPNVTKVLLNNFCTIRLKNWSSHFGLVIEELMRSSLYIAYNRVVKIVKT